MSARFHLSDVQFKDVSDPEQHAIEAYHPSFGQGSVPIGSITWRRVPGGAPMNKQVGEIDTIDVMPEYQRKGVGRKLYHLSQQFDTPALHSRYPTAEGKKFAKSVGGPSVG